MKEGKRILDSSIIEIERGSEAIGILKRTEKRRSMNLKSGSEGLHGERLVSEVGVQMGSNFCSEGIITEVMAMFNGGFD